MSNDVISEMLYGDRMIFAPDCDVAAGAVIKIKGKAGVALEDIAAGHDGEFCLCGPFTFACAKTAAFREGETVAFDPKTNLVVPLNVRGSFPLGVCAVDVHRGDEFVFVELNAQHRGVSRLP